MRRVHDKIEVEVQRRTSGEQRLVAFTWHGTRFVVGRMLGVWLPALRSPIVYQRIATIKGEVFELHAEVGGQWMLDAIPNSVALKEDGEDTTRRAG
jgi:hypothetical protein